MQLENCDGGGQRSAKRRRTVGKELVGSAMGGARANYGLLATVQVRLLVKNRMTAPIRAICDTGAQINLISSRIVAKFRLSTLRQETEIALATGAARETSQRKISAFLVSSYANEPLMPATFSVVGSVLGVAELPLHVIPH